ncbi:MAG: N-acetylmuramoyl-L-alanine amidase [Rhodospirillaceae bacterium]|nr:N-acetylmuramoyl-L-alanine amidase [Rhodospirillaceae bacterium]
MPNEPQRLKIVDSPSPNFGARKAVPGLKPVSYVVLHYTGMKSAGDALARLADPAAQVSAHYVVDDDGQIYRMVAEEHRAWHAGVSYWKGVRDLNSVSVGIEITNPGHDYGYRDFPAQQIASVEALVKDILARHKLSGAAVIGHSDIAPGRKIDPGELFPWAHLAQQGIGLWPTLSGTKHLVNSENALQLLSGIGYATPLSVEQGSDVLTSPSDCIAAFQRHYRPRKIDGILDAETVALIQTRAASASAALS